VTRLFAAALLLSLSASAVEVETGDVKSIVTLDTAKGACSAPTTGCLPQQFVSVPLRGRSSAVLQLNSTAFNAVLTPYASYDGGLNWYAAILKNNPGQVLGAVAGSVTVNETAFRALSIFSPYGNATDLMVAMTTATAGTSIATLTATNSNPTLGLLSAATVKGTQVTGALQTQDFKDAGRSYLAIGADGVTPAIAETVITFVKTVADTQTTGQTSYTITSAKTLRLQAICTSFTAGATANRVRVALRLNTGGACVAGSNILLPVAELAPNFGTAAAAEGGAHTCLPIPDGLEIAGNGTKAICLTESATAAAGTLTVALVGYEY
jgi:hypothetical protein